MDELIFSALEAINEDWTSHVASAEDELKQQVASQQQELGNSNKALSLETYAR